MTMQEPPNELMEAVLRDAMVLVSRLDAARALWQGADAYYFRSVARLQRLWEVCHISCKSFYQIIDVDLSTI